MDLQYEYEHPEPVFSQIEEDRISALQDLSADFALDDPDTELADYISAGPNSDYAAFLHTEPQPGLSKFPNSAFAPNHPNTYSGTMLNFDEIDSGRQENSAMALSAWDFPDWMSAGPGSNDAPAFHTESQRGLLNFSNSTFPPDDLSSIQGALHGVNGIDMDSGQHENNAIAFSAWDPSELNQSIDMHNPDFPNLSQEYLYELDPSSLQYSLADVSPRYMYAGGSSSQQMAGVINDLISYRTSPPNVQGDSVLFPMPTPEFQASSNDITVAESEVVQQFPSQAWALATPNTCTPATEANMLATQAAESSHIEQSWVQLTAVTSSPKKALKEPTPKDWEQLRPIIYSLNRKHTNTFTRVKEILRNHHGFRTRRVQAL